MYEKILRVVYKLENSIVLSSAKKGFLMTFPLVLVGSIALLIRSLPLPAVQTFLTTFAGGILDRFWLCVYDGTIGFMSIYLVLSISYYYAKALHPNKPILHIMAMITSLICFMCSFGTIADEWSMTNFGFIGVFTAILCALIATRIFITLYTWIGKDFHLYSMGADDNLKASLITIFPMSTCILLFVVANLILSQGFGVSNFNELISIMLVSLFGHVQSELGSGILFTLILNLLWVFGIHGGNALNQVAQTLFVPAITDPNAIISKSFMDVFAQIGGSGSTLCLVLALLLVSRSSNNRRLAGTATPMVLLNINELLIFGFPIVLNPLLVIPFVLVPVISLLIAYSATLLGLLPVVNEVVGWSIPIGLSGYTAVHSFSGTVVQLVIVAVGTLLYIPFVRLADNIQGVREAAQLDALIAEFCKNEKANAPQNLLSRQDDLGQMAKILVVRFREELGKQNVNMHYQPQVGADDRVVGAEALLRWRYNEKSIYPPLAVALAREDGFLDLLTWNVLHTVCDEISELREQTFANIRVSVNIVVEQLDNLEFVQKLIALLKEHDACNNIYLEITEETSLQEFVHIQEHIELLYQYGISVAIDDFGMGQTSLTYLKTNNFQYVKLDGQLVCQIVDNSRCSKIITSVVLLGKSLGFQVIAEYVEDRPIKEALMQLGCRLFQGYYYSPAVSKERFIAYFHGQEQLSRPKEAQLTPKA